MNKSIYRLIGMAVIIMAAFTLQSFIADDQPMTKVDGAFVVNTTTLGKSVEGYAGPTPVKVFIRGNKVERIEFLPNQETPKYFDRVKKFLQAKWNGLKVRDAQALSVDAVTGATYSSEAVAENVRVALDYYLSHKK